MTTTLLPGATIAILGGGPMGRLITLAARGLGYRVHVLEDDPECSSEGLADRSIRGALTDVAALTEVVQGCDVVTTSVEQVPGFALELAARHAPVRPGVEVLEIAQDRARERAWLEERGVAVGDWRAASTRDDLVAAAQALGGVCYVKPRVRRAGDRGPILVTTPAEAAAAWVALRGRACVVERRLPVDLELSVLVARSPGGAVQAFPVALSRREHARLLWSVMPGPVPPQLSRKAQLLASYVASRIALEGVMAVELFVLRDSRLVVNELVPAPHRTFHATEMACATSQCEQLVRAVTGLPLGATRLLRAGASVDVGGEAWHGTRPPQFDAALRVPGVRLQLYATAPSGAGRTIGHLTAAGHTVEEAVGTVLQAAAQLPADRTRRSLARRAVRRPALPLGPRA